MAVLILYVKLLLLVCVIKCDLNITSSSIANATEKQCNDDFKNINGKVINIKEYCKGQHCITKCCREMDRVFYTYNGETVKCLQLSNIRKVTNSSVNVDYTKIHVYKSNIVDEVKKTGLNLKDHYRFVMNKKMSLSVCATSISAEPMDNFYILENDSLVVENPNFYTRFVQSWKFGEFCMEHLVQHTPEGVQEPFLIYRFDKKMIPSDNTSEDNSTENILISVGTLISCFFLLLVLFVYGVIHELRNLAGIILMAYVATLAVTFFFKALQILTVYSEVLLSKSCKPMSVFLYYTTLSSFFWMNVMSLDIWWSFRGYYKSRPIHRRGIPAKFAWYALYSWGVPLLVTIAVAAIDYSDLRHLPNIFKPHFEYCFYTGQSQNEIRHYLYMPILALILVNWIFFLMTAFNIWRIRKNIAEFSTASTYNNNQNRFHLYLNLSVFTGLSWILEVSTLPFWLEKISTAYNSLFGVAIFFVFIFKRKIMIKLCKRFSIKSKFVESQERKYSRSSSATASNSCDHKRSVLELSATSS